MADQWGMNDAIVKTSSTPDFGANDEIDQHSPLRRGWNKMKQSVGLTTDLATGNYKGAAEGVAEADTYQRQNPGSPEGKAMMQAWQRGDGISGGLEEVGKQFSKDWNAAPTGLGAIRSVAKNVQAMGSGVLEQTPNMIAPMGAQLAGGALGAVAGSKVPVVGTAIGGLAGMWAGASLGNAAVEGGGMAQEALQSAGVNPQDKAATEAYLSQNGDKLLEQAGVKGGIIGAIDTLTMRLGHGLLTGPAKAASERAIKELGIDVADKEAVKAATGQIAAKVIADPVYKAATSGAGGMARNVGVAALEPAGEFAGEYAGQGVATGNWDEKNAFLEAASSIGQGAATFAGQKLYAGMKSPFGNTDPVVESAPGQAPTTPTDQAPPLQIGNTPDPLIGFADGTVARQSEVDKYINGLPPDQQPAARAKIMGLAPQPVATAPVTPAPVQVALPTGQVLTETPAPSLTNAAIVAVNSGATQAAPVIPAAPADEKAIDPVQAEWDAYQAQKQQQQDQAIYDDFVASLDQADNAIDEAPGETAASVAQFMPTAEMDVFEATKDLSDDEFFAKLGATPQEIADATTDQPSNPQAGINDVASIAPDVTPGAGESTPAVDAKTANLRRIQAANNPQPTTLGTQTNAVAGPAMDARTALGMLPKSDQSPNPNAARADAEQQGASNGNEKSDETRQAPSTQVLNPAEKSAVNPTTPASVPVVDESSQPVTSPAQSVMDKGAGTPQTTQTATETPADIIESAASTVGKEEIARDKIAPETPVDAVSPIGLAPKKPVGQVHQAQGSNHEWKRIDSLTRGLSAAKADAAFLNNAEKYYEYRVAPTATGYVIESRPKSNNTPAASETSASPGVAQQPAQGQWDSMTPDAKTDVLKRAGWRTNAGGLNVVGKNLLKKKWADIVEGTKATISKNIESQQKETKDVITSDQAVQTQPKAPQAPAAAVAPEGWTDAAIRVARDWDASDRGQRSYIAEKASLAKRKYGQQGKLLSSFEWADMPQDAQRELVMRHLAVAQSAPQAETAKTKADNIKALADKLQGKVEESKPTPTPMENLMQAAKDSGRIIIKHIGDKPAAPKVDALANGPEKADTDTKDIKNDQKTTTEANEQRGTDKPQPEVRRGVDEGTGGSTVPGSAAVQETPSSDLRATSGRDESRATKRNAQDRDFAPGLGGLTREGSWFDTAKRNIDLIELAIKIESENRPATPDEQAQLSKYVGFGASAIRNDLFPLPTAYAKSQEPNRLIWPQFVRNERWKPLVERIDALPREWQQSILQSSQYAHYTSEGIIRSVWSALQRMGFTGGNVFEPGMGIGSFAMLMPNTVKQTSRYTGVEFDAPTAMIAKLLSPQQNMLHGDFIKNKYPKNFFDVNVGNPPFSQTKIFGDPDYVKQGFMLHDFFFAKGIDLVRPGGIQVFVTSKGTMDKQSDKARKYLSERADLLGAIRLPSTAFEGNAGTSVVTDVIFLKKRAPGEAPGGHPWAKVATVETPDGPVVVNEYFAANPHMVLGQQRISGNVDDEGRRINSNGQGGEKYTVVSYDKTPAELDAKFAKAIKNLPTGAYTQPAEWQAKEKPKAVDFDPAIKREGVIYLGKDGALMRVDEGVGKSLAGMVNLSEKEQAWFKSYVGLRDKVQAARFDQLNDGPWEKSLAALNKAYDAFRKEHGPIKDFRVMVRKSTDEDGKIIGTESRIFKNRKLYREDYDNALITSLEEITEDGDIVKAPFLKGRTIGKPVERVVRSIGDALAVSLDEIGSLSLDDVGRRLDLSRDEAIEALGAQVYQAPTGEWQLADEYLSGDVVAKLEEAEQAAQLQPELRRNVEALKAVQPEKLGPSQISAKLGASWIPASHVNEFASEIGAGAVTFDPRTETWQVDGGNLRSQRNAGAEYGTAARSPSEILEAVLNSRSIKVTQTVDKKTVTDEAATTAANEMAKKIKDKFKGWVWTDTDRSTELVERYNKQFNNIAPRRFDGSHLTLPGVSLRFKLHPHQLRAIWRMVQTGNTYLAHAVGAGKTIEMIAGGMEQKRLGLIKKPIYVVPNHMLEQFSNEFMELYPMANIMVADDENFSPERRKAFVAAATLNNPDAIVITHDAFQRIGVKEESVAPIRDEILADLEIELSETAKSNDARVRRGQLEQQIEAVKQRFDLIIGAGAKDSTVKFEDMGVDFVFADEAHVFRKLDFHTAQQIKGIDPNGSKRALDMYVKTRILDGRNPGRSMVFASGTPVTNTMGELYTIMRFFAGEALDKAGISTFDAWARQFGEVAPALEPNAAGKYELIERFAKFDNVPELMSRVRQFMDVLTSDNLGALVKRPDIKGGKPNLNITAPNKALQEYMKGELARRIEISKAWKPSKDQPSNPDPIVAIITDGRFAALDPRFFGGKLEEGETSLLMDMGNGVVESYHATKDSVYKDKAGNDEPIKGSTQLVFYNLGFGEQSQKNRGFNSRAAFTKILTDGGIPRGEIYWFDDANTDAKKEAVFKDVRNGKVKVLIGSAKKMGTGVNVQKRLAVLHYQDPPWFPADVEQPHGRIIRQGNQNAEGAIEWYTTKGTYQSTMWQMVARKQRFIDQAFTGDKNLRSMDDLGEASLFEQAAAVASGDPRALQLAGLRQDVERLERLQSAHASEQISVRSSLMWARSSVESLTKRITKLSKAFKAIGERYFSFTGGEVDGANYAKVGEFGQAVKEAFNKTAANAVMKPASIRNTVIAKLGTGITVSMDASYKKVNGISSKPDGAFDLMVDVGDMPLYIGNYKALGTDADAVGLARRIFNQVNSVDQDLKEAQRDLISNETDVVKLGKKYGAPFEHQQEMADRYSELKRLENELHAESSGIVTAQTSTPNGAIETRSPPPMKFERMTPAFSRTKSPAPNTPISTIRQAIEKAYGNLLGKLEGRGLVVAVQTQDEAIEAAARARADKTGQPLEEVRASLMASVSNSVAVDTPAFQRWFGNSKAVDAQGKPLVVYHGTTAEISAFQQNKATEKDAGWYGRGIYFTADPDTASTYSRYEELQGKELSGAPRVMPVYVSIQNPYVWPTNRRAATTPEEAAAIRKELEAQGHDGVIVPNEYADPRYAGHYEVVAFRPEQIKSAIGNNGEFDPGNPDIRRSADGSIQGFFDPQTGQSFLIADNLTAEAAPGVLMHEVGIHMAADGSLDKLFSRAKAMTVMGKADPFMAEVAKRMKAANETSGEEAAAYITELYERDRANAPNAVKQWFKDLLAAVRAWLFKHGALPGERLTAADIAAVARANARGVANKAQGAGDIRFSMESTIGDIRDGLSSTTVTDVKHRFGNRLSDFRNIGLQFLGRRQLVDIYEKLLPQLNRYDKMVSQMDADKTESSVEADNLTTDWGKLKDEGKLASVMHDATLAQIDPSKPYQAGDDANFYDALKSEYDKLLPGTKEVYAKARDMYSAHHEKVRTAIKERIERSVLSSEKKKNLLEKMDGEFFKRVKGVYFPLARFGQYLTIVKAANGETLNVSRSETMTEAEQTRRILLREYPATGGFQVGKVLRAREFNAARDGVGRGFMADLFQTLESTGASDELQDSISQLYLASLPDLSWAKHGIHRKGTPGFSQDARRAFAQNMFHGGTYLAKLRYADQMQSSLDDMQEYIDGQRDDDNFDSPKAQNVMDEMVKRHDSMMNPQSNPISTALTSFGFVFHLGLSPASAVVNLTQTAMVAYPLMGAKWGFDKAATALALASKQTASNRNDISKVLAGDELKAYTQAVNSGVIDVTQSHDLAGIAQGEDSKLSAKLRPIMKWSSFMFHHAERFNRQVTFVAAYRLAKQTGQSHETAYEQAVKATYGGHFDYSASNRARVMQGNVAKVVLLFKQYAQNMIYTLSRNLQQAIQAETPAARKEARRAISGLLVSHTLAAGVFGLPVVGTLLALASAIGGDDDEPWDAKVALQNMLADTFGNKAAEVMVHGVSRLTPWDISGRVGLDKLLLPDIQEGLQQADAVKEWMAAALGPVAGIAINAGKGMQDISQGSYLKGLESMMPAALRNPLKSVRYGTEGNIDKTGVAINDEVSYSGVVGQFLGFSPSETRLAQEGKSAVLSADRRIQERRSSLVRKFAMSAIANDEEGKSDARSEISTFNEKNPTSRINPMQLMQSVRARRRRIAESESGVYLPRKRQDAREAGRFAEVE